MKVRYYALEFAIGVVDVAFAGAAMPEKSSDTGE